MRYFLLVGIIFNSMLALSSDGSETIRSKINKQMEEFTKCYDESPSNKANKQGKVVVVWDVNDKGDVSKALVNEKKTQLKDKVLHDCIIKIIKKMNFSPAPKDGFISYSYPFWFTKN